MKEKKELIDFLKKKEISLNFKRIGNFSISVIIIHFIFFGIICNYLNYNTDERLIWFYQLYFEIYHGILILILIVTSAFLVYQEDISIIGIKQVLRLGSVIIIFSVLWYWEEFGFSINPFILIFGFFQGYLNFLILFTILLIGALIGRKFKQYKLLKQGVIQLIPLMPKTKDYVIEKEVN
ncbi:MAG: hypothetical protein K9W44_10560 [Candidatus Lokiarchaeota archaeon]|nr:hypothetical protein [Candidatus Harpocratesius repetitus]